jgi:hypothetical protein
MEKGGEDAYMLACGGIAIGVADGVGGWAEDDVDAGAYARAFLQQCALSLERQASV